MFQISLVCSPGEKLENDRCTKCEVGSYQVIPFWCLQARKFWIIIRETKNCFSEYSVKWEVC